jgi:hypothetical protein
VLSGAPSLLPQARTEFCQGDFPKMQSGAASCSLGWGAGMLVSNSKARERVLIKDSFHLSIFGIEVFPLPQPCTLSKGMSS